jgi:nucleoside-diphosphate-sugar epimerase
MPSARYLVTGGAGFVGCNIVAALVAAGERVRVLDNLATGRWENLDGKGGDAERITGDIRDAAVVAKAMEGVEVVFHEAALGSVPRSVSDPIESNSVNVGGTVTVLDVARRSGVRRVIFAASSSAYGETEVLPKHEELTPMPLSPYAITKLACEGYVKVFAALYGIETLNLRYFNVFGPGQSPDGAYAAAIPRFVDAALSGRPVPTSASSAGPSAGRSPSSTSPRARATSDTRWRTSRARRSSSGTSRPSAGRTGSRRRSPTSPRCARRGRAKPRAT